jgi:TetR/AcrR family transcriptional repressor of bet genes
MRPATAIAEHGLSALDLREDGRRRRPHGRLRQLSLRQQGSLLIATLREVSEEHADVIEEVLAAAGDDALKGLLGIIDASLSPQLSASRKVAVWYAFLAESSAREDYQRICGDRDDAFYAAVTVSARS